MLAVFPFAGAGVEDWKAQAECSESASQPTRSPPQYLLKPDRADRPVP
jgi:hypothetical protein